MPAPDRPDRRRRRAEAPSRMSRSRVRRRRVRRSSSSDRTAQRRSPIRIRAARRQTVIPSPGPNQRYCRCQQESPITVAGGEVRVLILSKNRAGVWASAALLVALTGCGNPPSSTGPVGSRSPTGELSSPPAADRTGGTPSTSTLQPSPRNRTAIQPPDGDRGAQAAGSGRRSPQRLRLRTARRSRRGDGRGARCRARRRGRPPRSWWSRPSSHRGGRRPRRVSATNRRLVRAALTNPTRTRSSLCAMQIPGRPGPAMTRCCASIGDSTTVAPDALRRA